MKPTNIQYLPIVVYINQRIYERLIRLCNMLRLHMQNDVLCLAFPSIVEYSVSAFSTTAYVGQKALRPKLAIPVL